MKALADRVGWAALTVTLTAGAALASFTDAFWLIWLASWCLAGYAWHRWTTAAWKTGADAINLDRVCWLGAVGHLWLGGVFREWEVPGWAFLWACSGLLWIAGFQAQRPRVDRKGPPRSAAWCLGLAALCWPAMGAALGVSAGQTQGGFWMGVVFAAGAAIVLFSSWAIGFDQHSRATKAQAGSLAEDLRLLWDAGTAPRAAEAPAEELSPLSGYAFVSESASPPRASARGEQAGAAEAASVDRPTLVVSGGFKVDAEKALEKLSRFRSADPADFILGFFRTATAAGAGRLAVATLREGWGWADGLQLEFDGRPLDSAALADPLGALLTAGLDGAERELATGLLGALALPSCRVFIASGERDKRRSLRAALKGVAPWEVQDPGAATFIDVRWRGLTRVDDVVAALGRRAGMIELPWTIDGREQPSGPPSPSAAGWWRAPKGAAVWLAPRRDLQGASRLRLYRLGTLIEEMLDADLAPFPVEACVRDDAFTLDLSQAKVVRDHRFKRARGAVEGSFNPFVAWLEAEHDERWPKLVSATRRPAALRPWFALRKALGRPAPADAALEAWDRAVRQWLAARVTRGT